MGKHDKALISARLEALLNEANDALSELQPGLNARIQDGKVVVQGQLVCTGSEGPFDAFDILIVFEEDFPDTEPRVWEEGNRIPKEAYRHVYPSSEACCICIWEEWLWDVVDPSVRKFIEGPLHTYFVGQSIYEMTNEWRFGERSHDKAGIIEAYAKMLGIDQNWDVEGYVHLMAQNDLKGHQRCPCGSGRRVRDCHQDAIERMRERISRTLSRRMNRRLQMYRRT